MASCNNFMNNGIANCFNDNKVCIQAIRVFDACMKQIALEDTTLNITYSTTPVLPITFVSAKSYGVLTLSSLSVTPIVNSCCQRVQFIANIPIEFYGINANNVGVVATGVITQKMDLLMKIPEDSVIPATIQCTGIVEGLSGAMDATIFTGNLCITLITKVVAEVELLIKSEGYPNIPNCQDYVEEICSKFMNLPLYPKNTTCPDTP